MAFRIGVFRVPAQATFSKDIRTWAGPAFQCASDDFFRVAEAIDGGGVDPVDAEFEGAMNGGDGVVVILRSPGELPAGTAYGPGAIADWSDLHIRVAKLAGLHCVSPATLDCEGEKALQRS
jgi:hypothetical protein